jgi:Kef-type K+ transport system membrane component KefB
VIAVATVGKFGGSAIAARLAGETWSDSLTVGVLMNTRGLTEVVVLTVGLDLGIITPVLFTIMVVMALATTLMAAPALQLIARRRKTPATGSTDISETPATHDGSGTPGTTVAVADPVLTRRA